MGPSPPFTGQEAEPEWQGDQLALSPSVSDRVICDGRGCSLMEMWTLLATEEGRKVRSAGTGEEAGAC